MKNSISSIMDRDAYTCHYSASLEEVVRILVEKKVGGLIIIDDDEHVMGFISDGDIMRAVAKQKTRVIYGGDSAMVFYDDKIFEEKLEDLKSRKVMELASKKVICVSPDLSIDEVAKILAEKKIKKIPVVNKEGVLVGIARRSTILRYIFHLLFDVDAVK